METKKLVQSIISLQKIPLLVFIASLSLAWYFAFQVKSIVFLIPSVVVCLLVYYIPLVFKIMRILCIWAIIISIAIFYIISFLVFNDTFWFFLGIIALFLVLLEWMDYQRQKYDFLPIHRFYKRAILILGIVFFVLLSIVDILGSKSLASIRQKAHDLQLPLDLQALKRISGQDEIQEAKNAGPMFLACSQMLRGAYQKWLQEMVSLRTGSIWETMQSSPRKSLLSKKGIHEIPENRVLTATEWQDLEAFFNSTDKTYKMLQTALKYEQIQIPLEFPASEVGMMETKIEHLYDVRNCMNYLSLYADYLCEKKKQKEFFDTVDWMIQVSKLPSREPFLISNLIKMALQKAVLKKIEKGIQVFAGNLSIDSIKKCQKEIEPWCDFKNYRLDMAGISEFIWVYHTSQKSRWDFILNEEGMHGFFLPRAYFLFAPTGWTKIDLAYLMKEQMQKIEWSKEEKQVQEILSQKKDQEISYLYPIARMVMPSWERIYQKNFEVLALSRCSWVVLEALGSIKPQSSVMGALETAIKNNPENSKNPFTGNPLEYKKLDHSYCVYSSEKWQWEGQKESILGIHFIPGY